MPHIAKSRMVLTAGEVVTLEQAARILSWIATAEFDLHGSSQEAQRIAQAVARTASNARAGQGNFSKAQ
jgi:hypothetical protein